MNRAQDYCSESKREKGRIPVVSKPFL